jgi:hypothetical protein
VFAPEATVVHQCDLSNWEYLTRTFWNNRGNAVHDPRPGTVGRLLSEAAQFPWRPGFRTVADVQRAVVDRPPSAFVPTWIYMWLSRFAGYAGRIAGTVTRAVAGSPQPAVNPVLDAVPAIKPPQQAGSLPLRSAPDDQAVRGAMATANELK